ncbi:MAG: hypothetical protein ACLR43_09165 [Faecalibacillus faecis]
MIIKKVESIYTKGTEHLVDGTHYVLATDEEFENGQKNSLGGT